MAEKKTNKKEEVSKVEKVEEEKNETMSGLSEKNEIVLIYIFSILGFIFSLMKDKKVSEDMKFHYNQTGTLWIIEIIINVFIGIAENFFEVLSLISCPISLILIIFTIIALVKGYNGERYEIPVVTDISKSIWGKEE